MCLTTVFCDFGAAWPGWRVPLHLAVVQRLPLTTVLKHSEHTHGFSEAASCADGDDDEADFAEEVLEGLPIVPPFAAACLHTFLVWPTFWHIEHIVSLCLQSFCG